MYSSVRWTVIIFFLEELLKPLRQFSFWGLLRCRAINEAPFQRRGIACREGISFGISLYNVRVFFQRAHVATVFDTSLRFKVGLTAIFWKNCPSPLGTSPFWYASGAGQETQSPPEEEVPSGERHHQSFGLIFFETLSHRFSPIQGKYRNIYKDTTTENDCG